MTLIQRLGTEGDRDVASKMGRKERLVLCQTTLLCQSRKKTCHEMLVFRLLFSIVKEKHYKFYMVVYENTVN